MLFQTLDDWLQWLESLHPNTIDLGLERVQRVADRLALDFSAVKVFTVAGTNGKGSCVATLEALLRASGEKVGAYTSPHFIRYNERVRIEGREATDEELCAAFDKVESVRADTALTYFEYGTLAALVLFVEAGVSAAVLEVGLGGRLDAVNIIDPSVAIVTSVDIDHQDWLGDNREAIGLEKAGIFRADKPALCADLNPPQSILDHAKAINAPLLLGSRDFSWHAASSGDDADNWSWQGSDSGGQSKTIMLPATPLPQQSIAAAIQAFFISGTKLEEAVIQRVVAETRLIGRCQNLTFKGKKLLIDVAHNPAAAEFLIRRLQGSQYQQGKIIALFAAMMDKDLKTMLNILKPEVDRWALCGLPEIPRAASVEQLQEVAADLGLTYSAWDTVASGFEHAVDRANAEDVILILGSFYTVAAVIGRINDQ